MTKRRLLSATLGAALLLTQAGGAVAQTPPPIERTPEMEAYAAELAAIFPETVAGVSLMEYLEIDVGQELLAELDPSDPDDAEDIALLEELVATIGVSLDDAATAGSYARLDEESYAYLVGLHVRGGDVQPALPLFIAAFEADIPDALVEQGQVGDQEVTMLRSAAAPHEDAFALLARGNMLWMLAVPTEHLEELVGSLPEST
jgi:hypothetical protein